LLPVVGSIDGVESEVVGLGRVDADPEAFNVGVLDRDIFLPVYTDRGAREGIGFGTLEGATEDRSGRELDGDIGLDDTDDAVVAVAEDRPLGDNYAAGLVDDGVIAMERNSGGIGEGRAGYESDGERGEHAGSYRLMTR